MSVAMSNLAPWASQNENCCQKRHWNFSLDVMYGAMDIRQPDDAVDFEMDEFCARLHCDYRYTVLLSVILFTAGR